MVHACVGNQLDPAAGLVGLHRGEPLLLRSLLIWHFEVVTVKLLLVFLACDQEVYGIAEECD